MLDKTAEKRIIGYLKDINTLLIIQRQDERVDHVMEIVGKLPCLEKEVIQRKYLHTESDYTSHQDIYQDMGISSLTYSKIRLSALFKIAFKLGAIEPLLKKSK